MFSDENMKKHVNSIDAAILDRIRSKGPGHVFVPADFLDLGSRAAVDQALSRNTRAGHLHKAARGLYHLPVHHPVLGQLSPSADAVVRAVTRQMGARVQASGGQAANDWGISDQVPVQTVFLTDGRTRCIQLGKARILLKHASPRTMSTAGTVSGPVIQALRWLGRRHVDDTTVSRLRHRLSNDHKAQLLKDVHRAPAWVADIMRRIASPGETAGAMNSQPKTKVDTGRK